jgi:hypothetical protein
VRRRELVNQAVNEVKGVGKAVDVEASNGIKTVVPKRFVLERLVL